MSGIVGKNTSDGSRVSFGGIGHSWLLNPNDLKRILDVYLPTLSFREYTHLVYTRLGYPPLSDRISDRIVHTRSLWRFLWLDLFLKGDASCSWTYKYRVTITEGDYITYDKEPRGVQTSILESEPTNLERNYSRNMI